MNNNEVQKRLFTSESVTEGHPDKVCLRQYRGRRA